MAATESASKTVTVACKLPHGLTLRLFDMVEGHEPILGGGQRTVKIAQVRSDIEFVTLNGYAAPQGMAPRAPVVGGFALTHNVDAEFFGEWLKQNKDLDAVKKGLVFAYGKPDDAVAKAEEHEKLLNGVERIDPDPVAIQKRFGMRKITTADVKR